MILTDEYRNWLADLKGRIRRAHIKASLQVNDTLLRLYWDMGGDIAIQQMGAKRGSGFFEQLSRDLKREFPDMKGFSVQNLRCLKHFYLFYSNGLEIRQQPVGKLTESGSNELKSPHRCWKRLQKKQLKRGLPEIARGNPTHLLLTKELPGLFALEL
jgi:hypothetical protein